MFKNILLAFLITVVMFLTMWCDTLQSDIYHIKERLTDMEDIYHLVRE